ncbi:hypothetical protein V8F20_006856 [Naviculisporaceae sp. PSN 640]
MAEPPRDEALAHLLVSLKSNRHWATEDFRVLQTKLLDAVGQWRHARQELVNVENLCRAEVGRLRPTDEELIPFEEVQSRPCQLMTTRFVLRQGNFQLEYKEIPEDTIEESTEALRSSVLASSRGTVLPLRTNETVAEVPVDDGAFSLDVVPQLAEDDRAVPLVVDNPSPQLAAKDTALPLIVNDSVSQPALSEVTIPQLAVDDSVRSSSIQRDVPVPVQHSFVSTVTSVASAVVPDAARSSSPLTVRDRSPTPPWTHSSPTVAACSTAPKEVEEIPPSTSPLSVPVPDKTTSPPRAPSSPLTSSPLSSPNVVSEVALPPNSNLTVPPTEPVVESHECSEVTVPVPTVERVSESQWHDWEKNYSTDHLYDATPPRSRRTPLAPPRDAVAASVPIDPTTPDMSEDELTLETNTIFTKRVTRASRAASHEPLWGVPIGPLRGALFKRANRSVRAEVPIQVATGKRQPKKMEVRVEQKATRSVTKSGQQHQGAENIEPSQPFGPSVTEIIKASTTAKTQPSVAKPGTKRSQRTEEETARKSAKTMEESTPSQSTSKGKFRHPQGEEANPAAKGPPTKGKSVRFADEEPEEEPVESSGSRRSQRALTRAASNAGATSITKPASLAAVTDNGARTLTMDEVEAGGYWVFENGATRRTTKLFVLRCPYAHCKNPVFSKHPFKKNRAVEHLRNCTEFQLDNATDDKLVECFGYLVRSDQTGEPVTREWARRHNATLIPKTRSGEDLRAENEWEGLDDEEE